MIGMGTPKGIEDRAEGAAECVQDGGRDGRRAEIPARMGIPEAPVLR